MFAQFVRTRKRISKLKPRIIKPKSLIKSSPNGAIFYGAVSQA